MHFVDPRNRETLEGCWSAKLKNKLKTCKGINPNLLPSYLDEALFRSWCLENVAVTERKVTFLYIFCDAIRDDPLYFRNVNERNVIWD